MGTFPRNDNTAVMPEIDRINANLASMADGRKIRYLNINDRLADHDGKLHDGMMNDRDKLHPLLNGYQVWADALKPVFTELLGAPPLPALLGTLHGPEAEPATTASELEVKTTRPRLRAIHPPADDLLSCNVLSEETGPGGLVRTSGRTRGPPYGRRITFIRFGSLRYKRPNHSGPSASGATALISGSTRIMPSAISLIAAGYSPFDAHDP
jgi:hypothetical protein